MSMMPQSRPMIGGAGMRLGKMAPPPNPMKNIAPNSTPATQPAMQQAAQDAQQNNVQAGLAQTAQTMPNPQAAPAAQQAAPPVPAPAPQGAGSPNPMLQGQTPTMANSMLAGMPNPRNAQASGALKTGHEASEGGKTLWLMNGEPLGAGKRGPGSYSGEELAKLGSDMEKTFMDCTLGSHKQPQSGVVSEPAHTGQGQQGTMGVVSKPAKPEQGGVKFSLDTDFYSAIELAMRTKAALAEQVPVIDPNVGGPSASPFVAGGAPPQAPADPALMAQQGGQMPQQMAGGAAPTDPSAAAGAGGAAGGMDPATAGGGMPFQAPQAQPAPLDPSQIDPAIGEAMQSLMADGQQPDTLNEDARFAKAVMASDSKYPFWNLDWLTGKNAAQDNSAPRFSATGESKGLSYNVKKDHYAKGEEAWESVGEYLKKKPASEPKLTDGKHAGDSFTYALRNWFTAMLDRKAPTKTAATKLAVNLGQLGEKAMDFAESPVGRRLLGGLFGVGGAAAENKFVFDGNLPPSVAKTNMLLGGLLGASLSRKAIDPAAIEAKERALNGVIGKQLAIAGTGAGVSYINSQRELINNYLEAAKNNVEASRLFADAAKGMGETARIGGEAAKNISGSINTLANKPSAYPELADQATKVLQGVRKYSPYVAGGAALAIPSYMLLNKLLGRKKSIGSGGVTKPKPPRVTLKSPGNYQLRYDPQDTDQDGKTLYATPAA